MDEKNEKWVRVIIDGYPRSCPESRLEQVLQNIENLKQYYLQKGVEKELIDKMYAVQIVRDEDSEQKP